MKRGYLDVATLTDEGDATKVTLDVSITEIGPSAKMAALACSGATSHSSTPKNDTSAIDGTNDVVPMPNSKKNADKNSGSQPKLLSGGNPQIPKGEGDEPVQAYIAAMPGWKRSLGERLDGLIVRTVPNVHKAVKWNQPFYGHEGEGWFLAFRCYTRYVQLQLFRGTSLDPVPPKASKHDAVRYFDIYENDDLDEDKLVSWIEQASNLPGEKM